MITRNMDTPSKIAVIGAGAIGGLVAGLLKDKGLDVILIARPEAAAAIQKNGLKISGAKGELYVKINVSERLTVEPDLAILATKTQDLEVALKTNLDFLKSSLILTTQNGVQADNICVKYLPKENIISSIVMFGATSLEPGKVVHNFEGKWVLGCPFSPNSPSVAAVSTAASVLATAFPVVTAENILGMKYLKVFVNANNCIPGILGVSMQEAFSDIEVSGIGIGIWKEGLTVIQKAGINLISLPEFPLERLTKLASMPTPEAAKIYSGIMQGLSQEPLLGSILQSIKRGRPSEIDYLNGEFVRLAGQNNIEAPLNKKLVEMVREVERSGKFKTKEELLAGVS